MLVISLGALLMLGGVLFMADQTILRSAQRKAETILGATRHFGATRTRWRLRVGHAVARRCYDRARRAPSFGGSCSLKRARTRRGEPQPAPI